MTRIELRLSQFSDLLLDDLALVLCDHLASQTDSLTVLFLAPLSQCPSPCVSRSPDLIQAHSLLGIFHVSNPAHNLVDLSHVHRLLRLIPFFEVVHQLLHFRILAALLLGDALPVPS